MTDYVNPSNSFSPQSEEMGAVFRYAGHTPAFIADTNSTLVSDVDSVGVTDGPLGAFAKVSTNGLDFTIDTGEAMVEGALLARDTQTTLSLPESSSGTIHLAWDPSVESGLIIDTEASGSVSGLPQTPLFDFTTDTSAVTGDTDRRAVGEHISVRNDRYETDDNTGMEVDHANDANLLGGSGPSFYASVGQNESITGAWTFENDIDVSGSTVDISDGRLDVRDNAAQISIYETDSGTQWNVAVSGETLNLTESGGDGLLRVRPGGDIEVSNGTLTNERGVNVVTGDPDQGHIFNGSSAPSDSLGRDGDIFVEY